MVERQDDMAGDGASAVGASGGGGGGGGGGGRADSVMVLFGCLYLFV